MLKVIPLLTDPGSHGADPSDSFDVIVPSLPGYGYSDAPCETGMSIWRAADLIRQLMQDVLGYSRFVASGGDWGVSFEGSDGIVAVADALGPVDAVVAHSAGCGMTAGAIGKGWTVERAAFIAPPLGEGDRERLRLQHGDGHLGPLTVALPEAPLRLPDGILHTHGGVNRHLDLPGV